MDLNFYNVTNRYAYYLSEIDKKIAYSVGIKEKRPFVGIVLSIIH